MRSNSMSKFLSLVLRHKPDLIGLNLDSEGWCLVEELIEKVNEYGKKLDRSKLDYIVVDDQKKRYSYSDDKKYIRANQGHSIDVSLNLKAIVPPAILYHGTKSSSFISISKTGIKKMNRHHVHLSVDVDTAQKVGSRRGTAVILLVDALKMHKDGYEFYCSENGVWLTDYVPVEYIKEKI